MQNDWKEVFDIKDDYVDESGHTWSIVVFKNSDIQALPGVSWNHEQAAAKAFNWVNNPKNYTKLMEILMENNLLQ